VFEHFEAQDKVERFTGQQALRQGLVNLTDHFHRPFRVLLNIETDVMKPTRFQPRAKRLPSTADIEDAPTTNGRKIGFQRRFDFPAAEAAP